MNFSRQLTLYEMKCLVAERDFNVLAQSAKMSTVEPCWYYLKLAFGFFLFAVTLLFIIHIFLFQLVKVFGHPVEPFFNDVLDFFLEHQMEFMSTCIFSFLSFYLLAAGFHGFSFNRYLFYPIIKN